MRTHPALLVPASRNWGFDRGTPVDRYYIDGFIESNSRSAGSSGDIRGRVLEVGDDRYARRFGDASAVEAIDVLDVDPDNPQATIIADLSKPDALSHEAFDCVILTEVLMLVFDFRAALANISYSLKPEGVLLMTVAGITRRCRTGSDAPDDFWRFTSRAIHRLLVEQFPASHIDVHTYGNVRSASAFLYGLAAEELTISELDEHDPDYEVTVAARAVKPAG